MTDPTAPKLDCLNCPSFLRPEQGPSKFGRSIGSSICGRYGKVLGKPGAGTNQNKAIREAAAENCGSYGQPLPPTPEARDSYVMLPDPTRRVASTDTVKRDSCVNCGVCKNFVPEGDVATALGWTAGLCMAKGKLLLTNKLALEARDCEYREFGPVTHLNTVNISMMPVFDPDFGANPADPVAAFFAAKAEGKTWTEPSEYVSDKEVTEEDKTAGIRAWRKIEDPDGSGKAVYLPVYDAAFFDDADRALVPLTGSDEHPELYVDHFGGVYSVAVAWVELDETPCLWGQPGTGKTELFRHLAWLMQLPFRRISITRSSEIDDIAGKMLFNKEDGTYFKYGRLSIAWTNPGVVCVDEPNTGPPDVWQFIRPMTDNSKQLVLDMNEGESLDRSLDCYPGMAMNPAWDVRNVGAMEIADADSNRLFHTFVDLPPEKLEKEIIQERVKLDGWELTGEQMGYLMGTARDIRNLSQEEGLSVTWAIRQQIKVARALHWFSPATAYRRAIGDALDPDQLQILLDQVKANWPDESDPDPSGGSVF